jgi:hypothetical protein
LKRRSPAMREYAAAPGGHRSERICGYRAAGPLAACEAAATASPLCGI